LLVYISQSALKEMTFNVSQYSWKWQPTSGNINSYYTSPQSVFMEMTSHLSQYLWKWHLTPVSIYGN